MPFQTKVAFSVPCREAWRRSVILPLALLLLLTAVLVSPVGDFPLNDDWAYAKGVRTLVDTHQYTSNFMALAFAQTFWGGLFAVLFGKSYTVLRFSTLLLVLVTLWATARSALELGIPRWVAVLCGAAVLANPIFLNLAYTFMTDVPFMAPLTLAGLFYLRGFRSGRTRDILLGSLFAVVASSVRQFGVILFAAHILTTGALWYAQRRRPSFAAAAAFLVPWLVGAAAYFSLETIPAPQNPLRIGLAAAIGRSVLDASSAMVYLGLFLLPVTAGRVAELLRDRGGWTSRQWAAFPWVNLLLFFAIGSLRPNGVFWLRPMPLLGNILYNFGTGPLTLRDTYLLGMEQPVTLGSGWWWAVTVICLLSASVAAVDVLPRLAKGLIRRAGEPGPHRADTADTLPMELFLCLWGFLTLAAPYFLVMGGAFDRYLISMAPPLTVLVASRISSPPRKGVVAVVAAACLLVYLPSLASVQNYMAWNRARWQGLDYLREKVQAHPFDIDGGWEFNGTYCRDELLRRVGSQYVHYRGPKDFYILGDTYAVSFNPRPASSVIASFPYYSWLGMEERRILVLKKDSSP